MAFYEREPEREVYTDEAAATVRFYEGLRALTRIPDLAQNFGWCLAQLAGAPDFEAQFRGMVNFLMDYQRFGLDEALSAAESVSGIPITLAADGRGTFPGRVVGLLGADEARRGHFEGVACAELDSSGEQFTIVDINVEDPGVAIIMEAQR